MMLKCFHNTKKEKKRKNPDITPPMNAWELGGLERADIQGLCSGKKEFYGPKPFKTRHERWEETRIKLFFNSPRRSGSSGDFEKESSNTIPQHSTR